MNRNLLLGIGIAAFVAVELFGVQTSEAQRIRNFLRRNNNNVNCQNCGVTTGSTGTVVGESSYVTQGAEYGMTIESTPVVSEGIVSEGTIIGEPVSSIQPAMESYGGGEIISEYPTVGEYEQSYAPSMAPVVAEYPMSDYPPTEMAIESGYPIESVPTDSFVASPANYEIAPQGCIGCGQAEIGVPAEMTSWTDGQIIDGGNYVGDGSIIEGGSFADGGEVIQSNYIESSPQVMGCATGNCGGAVISDSSIQGEIIEGSVVGGNDLTIANGSSAEQIISSEIISETPITAESTTESSTEAKPAETATESPAETTKEAAPAAKDAVPDAPPKEAPDSDDGKEA